VSFLDRRARKTLAHLAAPSGLSLGSVHTASRLLTLLPRKVTLVLRLTHPEDEARICFCSRLSLSVDGESANLEGLRA
jgi:hypothetical protein